MGRDAEGRVVFTPFTAPGDHARVRVRERRRRFARAELVELLAPGPGRVEPRCPVFGRCGGCAWQHLASAAQRAAKARIVADALGRVGGLALPGPLELRPSPAYGYRARTRVLCAGGRVGYRRRRSHALEPVGACPVLVPELEARLGELAAHPPERDGEYELAAGEDGSTRVVRLPARGGEPLWLRSGGERLRVSPGVFFQANAALRDVLAEAVARAAGEGDRALELFAGTGLFTLGLARRFARVEAVEGNAAAAADLAHNAERAGRTGVAIERARAERALAAAARRGRRPDAVVLDPPRVGLAPGAAQALARLDAPRVVYLSCDPATLARDLRVLAGAGYALEALSAFDLFPQTPHIEVLAVLGRGRVARGPTAP